jgi:two-component system, NarL family, sensor histidine kinase DesK
VNWQGLRGRLSQAFPGTRRPARLAQAVLGVVLLGFGAAALITALQSAASPQGLALVLAALPLIVLIQVVYFGGQLYRDRPRFTPVVLLTQSVLVWAPMLVLGQAWLGQVSFLIGSFLLATPLLVAVPACLAMLAATAAISWHATHSWLSLLYALDATVITGLMVFGLTVLARLVVELHQARIDLASVAVDAERDRFARDLHDLLGSSLSAITLKSELVRAVVLEQPARAQEELSELAAISRQALKDVRRVAHGSKTQRSLADEVGSAVSLLHAAAVDVDLEMDATAAKSVVDDVANAVLREAITNVLRHSRPTQCRLCVNIGEDWLELIVNNDGVMDATSREVNPAGGLKNMRERVRMREGTFEARPEGPWFRLSARIPRATALSDAGSHPISFPPRYDMT